MTLEATNSQGYLQWTRISIAFGAIWKISGNIVCIEEIIDWLFFHRKLDYHAFVK